jgi:indolepyruvate ferredoxin oxidoreductase beta subunit
MNAPRPVTILIAALGGEGGGVLTGWIVEAAAACGYPVQSTSIPGVAQRTGATTYYIEMVPDGGAPSARRPVMALYPSPGAIDVMIASELLEAGRAMESGFVSPDRTTLIASTHRIYSIAEKSAMADGRYDTDRILAVAGELAKTPILRDLAATARAEGTAINAVVLGVLAGSGVVPIAAERFEAAVRAGGIAVESNLRGFAAGVALVGATERAVGAGPSPSIAAGGLPKDLGRRIAALPEEIREVAELGVGRLTDYQDEAYGGDYLDRVERLLACDGGDDKHNVTREAARHLALWMSYEDIFRVADLKVRRERFEGIRSETGASDDEPVRITEFFKPGPGEAADILPPAVGRRLRRLSEGRGAARWQRSMRIRSDRIGGFLLLWLVARLRRFRRHTLRFAEEQAAIEDWLAAIESAAPDPALAAEIAACATLLKGYGDTHRRGRHNYATIMDRVAQRALSASTVAALRKAALADPDGFELEKTLATISTTGETSRSGDATDRGSAPPEKQGGKAA